jgi:hypothetical protein
MFKHLLYFTLLFVLTSTVVGQLCGHEGEHINTQVMGCCKGVAMQRLPEPLSIDSGICTCYTELSTCDENFTCDAHCVSKDVFKHGQSNLSKIHEYLALLLIVCILWIGVGYWIIQLRLRKLNPELYGNSTFRYMTGFTYQWRMAFALPHAIGGNQFKEDKSLYRYIISIRIATLLAVMLLPLVLILNWSM